MWKWMWILLIWINRVWRALVIKGKPWCHLTHLQIWTSKILALQCEAHQWAPSTQDAWEQFSDQFSLAEGRQKPFSGSFLSCEIFIPIQFSSVQSFSRVRLFVTPWIAAHQASLSITISRSSLRLTSIESVMSSSHLILSRPLLLLPPIPPSIRDFSNESTLHMRWPKYWSFSFNIIPSKEIPGLISFRMDWLDLLVVQGTLKCLLQHHS